MTVEPSISTGSRTARGAMVPVRPTFHSTSSSRVTFSTAGSFQAMAQRGAREPDPAASWSAAASALTTMPSMPNGSSARSAPISSTRTRTASASVTVLGGTVVVAVVCTPRPATSVSTSLCGSSVSEAARSSPDAAGPSGRAAYAKNVIST